MKAKVLKKSIQNIVKFPPLLQNYITFLERYLFSTLIEEKEDYLIIDVKDEYLTEQKFHYKIWYQSKDKKFGLFDDTEMKYDDTEEKGWRVLFQRR